MSIVAKLNTPTKLYLYYPYASLTSPKVAVYDSSDKLVATRGLIPSTEVADLYITNSTLDSVNTVTLEEMGEYSLKYTEEVAEVVSTVSSDTLTVGINPTPDIDLNTLTKPTFHLEDSKIGNTTSVVKLRVMGDNGALVELSSNARAKYTGQSAVTTIAVNDADSLVFKLSGLTSTVKNIAKSPTGETTTVVTTETSHYAVNGMSVTLAGTDSTPAIDGTHTVTYISDTSFSITAAAAVTAVGTAGTVDSAPAKTATFVVKQAVATGAVAGTYAAGAATTTATISVDGKPDQTIDLSAVAGDSASYAAAINLQVRGVSCNVVASKLVIKSDTFGSSSQIVLSSFGATFQAYTGLSAATYTDSTTQNVADADAVTFAELKTVIEDAVKQAVAGDLLKLTQATDNKLILQSQKGDLGLTSKIELTSASAGLKTSLGFTTLGSGASAAVGTVSTETLAEYSTTTGTYSASISIPTEEGLYFILWYDDGTLVSGFGDSSGIQPKLVNKQSSGGVTAVKLNLGYRATPSESIAPHKSTSVLITRKSSGLPVASGLTDSNGKVKFDLEPGEYYTTLTKEGIVFDSNNMVLTIGSESVNVYTIAISYLTPTFLVEKSLGVKVCELYATLSQLDGTPLRDTELLVSLKEGPKNTDMIGTFGPPKVYKTNKNGFVKFDVVRGVKVEVSIMSVSLTRTFAVPDTAIAVASSTTAANSVITTSADHGLTTGDKVTIAGHSVESLNKTWEVTVTSTTQFTVKHQPGSAGTGGTALPSSVNLLTLMADGPDVFDIIKINMPSAPRRSL